MSKAKIIVDEKEFDTAPYVECLIEIRYTKAKLEVIKYLKILTLIVALAFALSTFLLYSFMTSISILFIIPTIGPIVASGIVYVYLTQKKNNLKKNLNELEEKYRKLSSKILEKKYHGNRKVVRNLE